MSLQRSPRSPRAMTPNHAVAHVQYDTPEKTRLVTAIEFARYLNSKWRDRPPITNMEAIQFAGFTKTAAYRVLKAISEGHGTRRHHNDPETTERRGRPRKVTQQQVAEAQVMLRTEGIAAKAMDWQELANEVGAEVIGQTMQRTMARLGWHKRLACQKNWLDSRARIRRIEYASTMLQRYPTKEHWRKVRFSDECHFGYGNGRQLHLIRQPGTRYHAENVQERDEPTEKQAKKFHVWAAIGYNFKSQLTFYDASNSNGKMNLRTYHDCILEPVVKKWLERGEDFVLEEDQDGGHGTGKKNFVREWKERHQLTYYFNSSHSLDLAPIENCWQVVKEHMKAKGHWDDDTTLEMIHEGWAKLTQEKINELIDSMPERLHDVIKMEGRLTGY